MWRTIVGLLVLVAAGVTVSHWPPARDYVCGHLDNNVGFLYSRGIGVHADPAEAVRWWEAAASHGSAAGELNLGYALQSGLGVPTDETKAAGWYEKAALQGVAAAANNLGSLYTNPMRGKPNLVLARAWFKRALHDGTRELAAAVADNLHTIEADMTPAQIALSDTALANLHP